MSRRIRLPRLRDVRGLRGRRGSADPGAENGAPAPDSEQEPAPGGGQPHSPAAEGAAAQAATGASEGGGPAATETTVDNGTEPGGESEAPRVGPLGFERDSGRLRRLGRPALVAAALLLAAGVGLGAGWLLFDSTPEASPPPPVAPTVVIEKQPQPEAAQDLGFPAFATRNTTRVGGSDPVADAAGVALASYPAVGGVGGPRLAVIAPEDSWQASLAAASLAAEPVGAPILLGRADEIPGFTAEALSGLSPTGLKRADGVQVVAIGDVASPSGLKKATVRGAAPAELALRIDRQRARLSGRRNPRHILVTSSKRAAFAMPAAAWAAHSGDPIAFADGDNVPKATTEIIERHPDASVYVLGPGSAIGAKALRKLDRVAGRAIRIGASDPVDNAIEFARFYDGSFGWNINDPGHGFTIANTDRPADAGAGAPLAAGGKPGPMLLTDSATEMPRALRNFLLDTKPGYSEDPTRAVYNHVWLLGDTSVISLDFQAQVDALTELARVSRGSGVPDFGPAPGTPENEPRSGRSNR